jgi:asparagine synthetase B (glutamine-hydrolysing)
VSAAARDSEPPVLRLEWDARQGTPVVEGPPHLLIGGEWSPNGGRVARGAFAEWCWDGTRLEVRTDRFGFQPLFWASQGTTLWLSPSIPAMIGAGAPAELDDAALAVFLRMWTFLDADTPFRAIRVVPPNARIVWERGQLTVEGARAVRPLSSLGREAALDGYVELFRAAALRDPVDPGRVTVPLTGGRDSRHILLELAAAGRPPARALTVCPPPPKSDDDLRIAALVAAVVGVQHVVLPTTAQRHADELVKNRQTSLCALEHFWEVGIVRWLAAHAGPHPVVFDGIGGDTLSEAKYMAPRRLELLRRGDLATYAAEELSTDGYLPALLGREGMRRFPRGLALERLTAELRTHLDAPNPVGSYRFWNRTRRTVALAPFGMLTMVAEVRAPFLDDALFDHLASLPGEMLVDRTFHTTAIARAHPTHAGIPYEDAASPRRDLTRYMLSWAADAARWLLAEPRPAHPLLRRASFLTRLGAFAALPASRANVAPLTTLATYLAQLEGLRTLAAARG